MTQKKIKTPKTKSLNFITSQDVYDRLINEDKILEIEGQIRFYLGDVSIVVKQRDVVGNIIQEWLQGWFVKKGIYFRTNSNSQMPPDFFLKRDDDTDGLLEVKAFNYSASPGFDIADFRMYEEEIIKKPYMLDVDYLIFGYHMSEDGVVTIKNLWLKKVWEITRPMNNWSINLQIKQNVVHKIRPAKWFTNTSRFKVFDSKEAFVSAIEEAVYKNPKTHNEAANWKDKFIRSYKKHFGVKINIPRWCDIKHKYEESN